MSRNPFDKSFSIPQDVQAGVGNECDASEIPNDDCVEFAKKLFLHTSSRTSIGESELIASMTSEFDKILELFKPKNVANLVFKNLRAGLVAEIEKLAANYAPSAYPIIFDECHELLISPSDHSNGSISLYRALRRAFIALVESPIVGIFLGTKSSLNDFIFNWKIDAILRKPIADNVCLVPPYMLNDTFDAHLTERLCHHALQV